MSVGVALSGAPLRGRLALRLALVAGAVLIAGLVVAALSWLVAPTMVAPPPRSPFGIGFREAAPAATGLGGWLLAVQSSFSRSLQAALSAVKAGGGWGPLIGIGFAYGVFHAAGPGHGKAVIAGYIVAGERALRRGCALSFAAALLQAGVAIGIVGVGSLILGATAAGMSQAGTLIETASFAMVALVGLALTWRKAGRLAGSGALGCGPDCAHGVVPPRDGESWRTRAGVVLAAGSRPCAGAVLLLVFALSQGMLGAGMLAVLAMALGTALTTSALASLAVFAKGAALRLAGGRGQAGSITVAGLELLAAAFVLVLGLAMLTGLALGAGGA
ncbi:nickel/cobalt transporter [Methylobacterium radiodurans]|uniref:Nickel/cobalt efflux system n=1 Tax=Methylobacterium radiodurans TaxID=2202828 RepID=A0A2U8VQS8_9HYPH|nr:nickel transporter [Methylobacterium radiodurans]AWN36044.1 nickel transporter [Methylobacterium radiodurans]